MATEDSLIDEDGVFTDDVVLEYDFFAGDLTDTM